jgi:hypothetical protein
MRIKTVENHERYAGMNFSPAPLKRWLGLAVTLGIVVGGVALGVIAAHGHSNAEAAKVEHASRTIRTNAWLQSRNLDVNSSADMMKALVIACDEIKSRGERC